MPSEVANHVKETEVRVALQYAVRLYGECLNEFWVRDFTAEALSRWKESGEKLPSLVHFVLRTSGGLPRKTAAERKRFSAYYAAVMKIFANRKAQMHAPVGQLDLAFDISSRPVDLPNPYGVANIVQFVRSQSGIPWGDYEKMTFLIDRELALFELREDDQEELRRLAWAFLSQQGRRRARHNPTRFRRKLPG